MTRKPDTVVVTFPTYVDIVVDLKTGETKTEYEAPDISAVPFCATTWIEGELAGEIDEPGNVRSIHPDDRLPLLRALEIVRGQHQPATASQA